MRASLLLMFMLLFNLSAIEEIKYEVLKKDGPFELRDYSSYIIAEIEVKGSATEAGNKAFRRLFRYISGNNKMKAKVAMTAPVTQEAKSKKIAMTAPVNQEAKGEAWLVSFVMPMEYQLEDLPQANDKAIKLRLVEKRKMAAVRYSGRWTESNYLAHKKKLETWVTAEKLSIEGAVVWARYNSPFSFWFMRRNEVLFPVK